MKFSLIVPTLNRVQALRDLFQSLVRQDADIEIIVVDQNRDDRLVPVVADYHNHFPILHLKEMVRGQSRARNIGRKHAQGDIVAFPDDDCQYPDGLLHKLARRFHDHPEWDGVIPRIYDLDEDENAFEFCGDEQSQEVGYAKAFRVGISCALFFRADVVKQIAFDESLGPGAGTRWACGDDTDYVYQCIDAGYNIYYDADLHVRHPNPLKKNNFRQNVHREYTYGVGKGYFMATHPQVPPSFLNDEYRAPYRNTVTAISKGNLRRAVSYLANGIGMSLGYQAGKQQYRE